jgi:hypothetical protein
MGALNQLMEVIMKKDVSIEAAAGAGHFMFQGAKRTFSFTVKRHKSGVVKGQAQSRNEATGSERHLVLNCLEALGPHSAIAGGVVSKSEKDTEIGQRVLFAFADNGQGSDDPPDQLTGLFFLPPVPGIPDCAPPPFDPPWIDIEEGNIHIQ